MTALQEYQRLECTGLWREAPEAQRREVIVSFGDATLVIADPKNARALAHWSLPAVLRLNPGERPARFSPGPEAGEDLEVDDEVLIHAIAKVHSIIESRRPHPGRLRVILLTATLAAVIALGALWMPKALIEHTARALPTGKRHDIGVAALADLTRLSGAPCSVSEGQAALKTLGNRLMPEGGDLYVLPAAVKNAAHLPGGIVLLGRSLIEGQTTPDAAAGHVIAEQLRAERRDPMIDLLRFAGLRAAFELLTTGNLPAGAITGYGEYLIKRAPAPIADDQLVSRFTELGVAIDGIINADEPILTDGDWVALQGICGR